MRNRLPTVPQIMTKNRTFLPNQNLTCANYSIYVATCVICQRQYVGHMVNKFSKRWSSHRGTWNKPDKKKMTAANSSHRGTINCSTASQKPPICEAYTVTFVEQTSFHSIDTCEDKWLNKLNARINIQSMILACVK